MKISEHFHLEELIASQLATRIGIDNYPKTPEILKNLTILAQRLDIIRNLLGKPVIVSSGYRCQKLNDTISKIGSRSTHVLGLAADFTCPQFGTPLEVFRAIKKFGLKYDQLIIEYANSPTAWVHVGFDNRMRQESLTFDGHTYRVIA